MTTPDEVPETEVIDQVNVHPNGPTQDDEMEVLGSLYLYDSKLGVFHTPKFEEE
jgi:hypothetical protein